MDQREYIIRRLSAPEMLLLVQAGGRHLLKGRQIIELQDWMQSEAAAVAQKNPRRQDAGGINEKAGTK